MSLVARVVIPWPGLSVRGANEFGFASGLTTIGLPSQEIVLSLLMFNIGVEAGQLFFVAVILAMRKSFAVLEMRWPRWAELAPGYAVGSLGAFWTIQRSILMFTG